MPTDNNGLNLNALVDLADQAAAVQSDLDGAAAAERTAGIGLLTAILTKTKSGLAAICSRSRLSESGGNDALKSWGGGDRTSRAPWKGVCIAGDDSEVREGRRDDNRGDIAGCGLWLRPDPTLAEIAYTGSWSRWQGGGLAVGSDGRDLRRTRRRGGSRVEARPRRRCQGAGRSVPGRHGWQGTRSGEDAGRTGRAPGRGDCPVLAMNCRPCRGTCRW